MDSLPGVAGRYISFVGPSDGESGGGYYGQAEYTNHLRQTVLRPLPQTRDRSEMIDMDDIMLFIKIVAFGCLIAHIYEQYLYNNLK